MNGLKNFKDNMENDQTAQDKTSSGPRYIIVNGSQSAHCCFEYTIVDTWAGKEQFEHRSSWNRTMCEVFVEEEAKTICDALNGRYADKPTETALGLAHTLYAMAQGPQPIEDATNAMAREIEIFVQQLP